MSDLTKRLSFHSQHVLLVTRIATISNFHHFQRRFALAILLNYYFHFFFRNEVTNIVYLLLHQTASVAPV